MSHSSINYWQLSLAVVLGALVIMAPDLALAASTDPFGAALCKIAGWFTGNTGKAMATIGITIIGIGALLGKVSWGMALIVGLGVVAVFGAGTIIGALASDGSKCATT